VHVSAELCRLFSEYMYVEYGDLDCDYVFVNLWGGRVGTAPRCGMRMWLIWSAGYAGAPGPTSTCFATRHRVVARWGAY
jgi:hypothetical protein